MILFLVIHLSGNLVFFMGREAFNSWANFLNSGPVGGVILAVEYYLLAAAVFHAVAGIYLTLRCAAACCGPAGVGVW